MTITITNGTLAQMQERLIPASGYGRPKTAAIVGADYTLTDGVLTLEPTSTTITITANGRVPIAVLDLDSLELPVGTYTITTKAKAANYRDSEASNAVTYVVQPELDTPTNLSVTDTTASFDEVEDAEKYEFFVDNVSIGEYPTVALIEFSITNDGDTTTYQAEDGMTWAEWVASEYNTDGYGIGGDGEYITGYRNGYYVADSSNVGVDPTDLIISNEHYALHGPGSEN